MLTEAEKERVFETASSHPEWQTAYWAALLTANSTMRPVELRRLLWRDIDPFQKLVTVRRSKTDAGSRVIPINPEAWNAIAGVKARADALGTYAPENYVFHRLWPKVEPGRPMGGWRSAWRTLRKSAAAANKEKGWDAMPKLATLRFYDLRQHADFRIMPTTCRNQRLGGARVGFMIGIFRGLPGKLRAYRRADIELA